jgi:hypothetical protein
MTIVLDFPRSTEHGKLTVPPYHTGHLGFIPDTEFYISLMSPSEAQPSHFEVVIAPFQSVHGRITQLSCMMDDEPGVVGRLTKAVSSLGINIVTQESSVYDRLDHHFVNMILDWTPSKEPDRPSDSKAQRQYQNYRALFPINRHRYVKLFETIVENCWDVLHCEKSAAVGLPSLNLRPIQVPDNLHTYGSVKALRHAKKPYYVELELPPPLIDRIRTQFKAGNAPLTYLVLSNTQDRALRVCFPKPELIPRILHLGFYHDDIPGALNHLLGPIATANFNILTSLLRKQSKSRSIWEAVLEYQGNKTIPQDPRNCIEWTARQFTDALSAADASELKNYNIEIGFPLYPRQKERQSWNLRLDRFLEGHRPNMAPVPAVQDEERHRRLLAKGAPDARLRIDLLKRIEARKSVTRPTIFLSYPGRAADHAEILKILLDKANYKVVEYQEPDAENILAQVQKLIQECDYFIGIWHHEIQGSGVGISPWMPFEFGVAKTLGKPTIIAYSKELPESDAKRIDPATANIRYTDIKFETLYARKIVQLCSKRFVPDRD